MSLQLIFRSLLPARFLAITGHFTMLALVTVERKDHVDSCLPFDFTEEEYEEQNWRLTIGSYTALALLAIELASFLSGVSWSFSSAILISIGTHLSGAIALTFFLFDQWDCDLFWFIFGWCSAFPAVIEILNLVGVLIGNKV